MRAGKSGVGWIAFPSSRDVGETPLEPALDIHRKRAHLQRQIAFRRHLFIQLEEPERLLAPPLVMEQKSGPERRIPKAGIELERMLKA